VISEVISRASRRLAPYAQRVRYPRPGKHQAHAAAAIPFRQLLGFNPRHENLCHHSPVMGTIVFTRSSLYRVCDSF